MATTIDPTGGQQAWTDRKVYARLDPRQITCATRHLCVVTTSEGEIAVTHHPVGPASAWHLENIDPGQNPLTVHRPILESISCPSRSFCAVTDDAGKVITSRDPGSAHASWQRHRIYGNQPLGSITCASAALCVASDGGSGLLASTSPSVLTKGWRSARFSTGTAVPLTSISCPTHTRCIAVSGADTYLTGPTS